MKHIRLYEDTPPQKTTLVIFGLPGSGKSKLAEEIQREEPEMQWQHYDDYQLRKAKDTMGKENQIISDGMVMLNPDPTREQLTQEAEQKGALIRFIYFENSPEQCKANIRKRAEDPHAKPHQKDNQAEKFLKQVDGLSSHYRIPKGEEPMKVWNPNKES